MGSRLWPRSEHRSLAVCALREVSARISLRLSGSFLLFVLFLDVFAALSFGWTRPAGRGGLLAATTRLICFTEATLLFLLACSFCW